MNIGVDLVLLFASLIAGLFGLGGGVLFTPLQSWFGIEIHSAATTSLFLILITSFSSTITFRQSHKVDWMLALVLEAPTTLGAYLGGYFSHHIPAQSLDILLAALLLIAAWFLFHPFQNASQPHKSILISRYIWRRSLNGELYQLDLLLMIPTMLLVGILTSMVGISGGVIKIPIMTLLFGVPMRIAVGSSAFMVGLTAGAGLLGHITVGHFDWQSALILAVPVFIGAQIGSRLSLHFNIKRLEKLFALFILLIACTIILQGLGYL